MKRVKNFVVNGRKIYPCCKEDKSIDEFIEKTPDYCKKCKSAKQREYYKKNRETIALKTKEYGKLYRQSEIGKFAQYKYQRKKYAENLNYKIATCVRATISSGLRRRNLRKDQQTTQLLGCSIEELKFHLESQFTEGMSWENYGKNGWEIDHIKPCASFNLTDPEQQKICFHYTNLQPLWGKDNREKSNKYEESSNTL